MPDAMVIMVSAIWLAGCLCLCGGIFVLFGAGWALIASALCLMTSAFILSRAFRNG